MGKGQGEHAVLRVRELQERDGKSLIMETSNRHREKE